MEGKWWTMSRGTCRLRTLDDIMGRLAKGRLRGRTMGVEDAHEEGRGIVPSVNGVDIKGKHLTKNISGRDGGKPHERDAR